MIMLALMVGMMILVLVMIMMGMMMLVLIMIMMIIMVGWQWLDDGGDNDDNYGSSDSDYNDIDDDNIDDMANDDSVYQTLQSFKKWKTNFMFLSIRKRKATERLAGTIVIYILSKINNLTTRTSASKIFIKTGKGYSLILKNTINSSIKILYLKNKQTPKCRWNANSLSNSNVLAYFIRDTLMKIPSSSTFALKPAGITAKDSSVKRGCLRVCIQ